MKLSMRRLLVVALTLAIESLAWGGGWDMLRNPPVFVPPTPKWTQDCPPQVVEHGCVKIALPLGETAVWAGRRAVSLRLFTNTDAPSIFTPAELNVVLDYTFARWGSGRTKKGEPDEVVFVRAEGDEVRFRFGEGESLGVPNPGLHREARERLQLVDAKGWATDSAPVYYDLYPGDGSVWRFWATNQFGKRGELVSYTDARGRTLEAADFGLEVIRDNRGFLRQVRTPSRLADIVETSGTSYEVRVYPLAGEPARDAEGWLFVPPAETPVFRLAVARGKDDRELLVDLWQGAGEARHFVYTFANHDWGLVTPEGVDRRYLIREGDGVVQGVELTNDAEGKTVARREDLYEETDWGYAKVRSVEGFGGASRWTAWDYCFETNDDGAYFGKVARERDSAGLVRTYRYDAAGRVTEARVTDVGGTFLEVTTSDYAAVAEGDVARPNDTRPRTVVVRARDLESGGMTEVSRTYYVYTPTEEIVERAATAGAVYGASGAVRTVRTWYAPDDADTWAAGRLRSVRHEDGALEVHGYGFEGDCWVETVTALHVDAPEPVAGRTTREVEVYDTVGNRVERRKEVFLAEGWRVIDRTRYVHNAAGKVIRETDFAGRETVSVWGDGCCGKVSETLPDGTVYTYAYDGTGRLIRKTRRAGGLDTVAYARDALGRVTRLERTGLNAQAFAYDALGRQVRAVDARGGVTEARWSADGNTVTNVYADLSTEVRRTDARGKLLEISGTAVRPRVYARRPFVTRVATGARWEEVVTDLLGRVVARRQSGANGSVRETTLGYDGFGRLASETTPGTPAVAYAYDALGELAARTEAVGAVWRKAVRTVAHVVRAGEVWREEAVEVSCSDAALASLTQTRRERLTGLSPERSFETEEICPRGNVTRTTGNDAERVTVRPSRANPEIVRYAFGEIVAEIDSACVTNRVERDALGRVVAAIDGRGNRRTYAYDARGLLASETDAAGATTAYGYDVLGRAVAVTNALGNVTLYEYDPRGNKIYEGGAVYPVRYAYDAFGNRVSMTTYRDESTGVGDTTTWTYDEAAGLLLAKTYADGKGTTYTYTDAGRLATRTDARGNVTTYAWDDWGHLLGVSYSDGTPSIAYAYDALGRQVAATDVAGTTTFAYDAVGQLVSETIAGLYAKTLTRHYDAFGREVGYSIDGARLSSVFHDPDTGRIAGMDGFAWHYLPGANLESALDYPNGAKVTWAYEPTRDLVTAVTNDVHSVYLYIYDLLGRRVSKNDEQYGYNARNELIAADALAYVYDDIGNRIVAEGKTYVANNLNQYTKIDDFVPEYDADGNQTLIQTSTGVWQVTYNAENRPIRWQSGDTVITMAFDRMGRRVEMRTVTPTSDLLQRFVYKDFLCVQQLRGPDNTPYQTYVWDPTEPIATRPLLLRDVSDAPFYYFHDGNKNVAGLTDAARTRSLAYAYSPYGTPSRLPTSTLSLDNPFQFSSEVHDSPLALTYYNYRHYDAMFGRWMTTELGDDSLYNLYLFLSNNTLGDFDYLGLSSGRIRRTIAKGGEPLSEIMTMFARFVFNEGMVREKGMEECMEIAPPDPYECTKDQTPSIRKPPREYCCVICYSTNGGGETVPFYSFISADIERRPCSDVETITPEYIHVMRIPWFVYE